MATLLLVGFSTRGLAEAVFLSKVKAYNLVMLDYFGDYELSNWGRSFSLTRDFGYEDFSVAALVQAANQLDYQALAYTSGVDNYPEEVEQLSEGRELLGNPGFSLRQVRDWEQIHAFFGANGFSYPRTLYEWPGSLPEGRWLLKPRLSGGGTDINWAIEGACLPKSHLLQQYQVGRPASVSFLANGQEARILGCSEQLCGWSDFGAPKFNYCGNLVPLQRPHWRGEFPFGLWKQLQKLVSLVTRQFGLRGLNGIDFILAPNDVPVILEVNPRYSASMELFAEAYGWDLFALHIKACQGQLPDPEFFPGRTMLSGGYLGKAIVYAPWDLKVGLTDGWLNVGVRDIPYSGEKIPARTPVCTVFAQGGTREECLARLHDKQRFILAQASAISGEGEGEGET